MKRVLFLTNTYFQIIVSIQLAMTKYSGSEVDIIISDHSSNYQKISDNLKKTKLFKNVYITKSRSYIHNNNLKNKIIRNFHSLIIPEKVLDGLIDIKDGYYDEFLFYNIDAYSYLLFDVLHAQNNQISFKRFEEGFVTYLHDDNISTQASLIRKLFLKKNYIKMINTLFVFDKSLVLYDSKMNLEEIEKIDKSDIKLKEIINNTFDYNNIKDNYSQKYIFFEESFFCDNKGIDDLPLIMRIAKIVGKENLLVKLHPRNRVDRFAEYGIETNKTIGIPWEVIQMNNDFSDKVFLTISSGSVLASRLYFNDNIKTYLLFNCTDNMSDMVTEEYHEYLDRVNKKFGLDSFIIPKNVDELEELLREEKKY